MFYEVLELGEYSFSENFRHVDKIIIQKVPPIITIRDGSFSSGKVALTCSSCNGILIDWLQIKHTICVTKTSMSKLKIVAPIAGRWILRGKDNE